MMSFDNMAASQLSPHRVFTTDHVHMQSLLFSRLLVKSVDSTEHQGWLAACDPVSGSLVLAEGDEKKGVSVQVVFGNSVISYSVLQESCECSPTTRELIHATLTCPPGENVSVDEGVVLERRRSLVKWLRGRHVPVENADPLDPTGSLSVAHIVRVDAPFTNEHCVCNNELVLQRICKLIEEMPAVE